MRVSRRITTIGYSEVRGGKGERADQNSGLVPLMFGENANDDSRGEAREKELSSRRETPPFRFFALRRRWIVSELRLINRNRMGVF